MSASRRRPVISTSGVAFHQPMRSPASVEFMRFTAPDAKALGRSIEDTRAKLSEAESRSDRNAVVDHAADLAGMLTTARREAEALRLLRKHEPLAQSLPVVEQVAWFWNALGTALQYLGKRELAEPYFAEAVSAAQAGGWRRIEATALHHWGRSLAEQGRLDDAESRISQALVIREELGERQESSRNALLELARLRAACPVNTQIMRLVPIEIDGKTVAPLDGAPEVVGQVIEATVALYGRRGFVLPWIGYLALEGEEIVGSCGFAGPPSEGEVEIAYFTFPGNEGRGVAKAMASSLMELTRPAAAQLGVQYIAHTLPEPGPSGSILSSLGFRLDGAIQHPEDGLVWKWRQLSPGGA